MILNETPQMQFFGDTIVGAIEKGQVAEWINSVLTSFNKMNKANQLEFMTLCNIYDFQESPLCKKRIIVEMIVGKVVHPKYYKHLKKSAHQSHLGRQKWAGFWQISLYIK